MKHNLKLSSIPEYQEITYESEIDFHLEKQKFSYCHNDLILTKYTNCSLTPSIKAEEVYLNRFRKNTNFKTKVSDDPKTYQKGKRNNIYVRLRSSSAFDTQQSNYQTSELTRKKQEQLRESLSKRYTNREVILLPPVKLPIIKH